MTAIVSVWPSSESDLSMLRVFMIYRFGAPRGAMICAYAGAVGHWPLRRASLVGDLGAMVSETGLSVVNIRGRVSSLRCSVDECEAHLSEAASRVLDAVQARLRAAAARCAFPAPPAPRGPGRHELAQLPQAGSWPQQRQISDIGCR